MRGRPRQEPLNSGQPRSNYRPEPAQGNEERPGHGRCDLTLAGAPCRIRTDDLRITSPGQSLPGGSGWFFGVRNRLVRTGAAPRPVHAVMASATSSAHARPVCRDQALAHRISAGGGLILAEVPKIMKWAGLDRHPSQWLPPVESWVIFSRWPSVPPTMPGDRTWRGLPKTGDSVRPTGNRQEHPLKGVGRRPGAVPVSA